MLAVGVAGIGVLVDCIKDTTSNSTDNGTILDNGTSHSTSTTTTATATTAAKAARL